MGLFDIFLSADKLYEKGTEFDEKKKYKQAFALYKQAADMGHADAAYNAAYDYEHGEGVDKDVNQAFVYYKKAVDLGLEKALFSMGYAYGEGQGVQQDANKALEWYRKSYAVRPEGPTANNLALEYIRVGQYDEALDWALKARELKYDETRVSSHMKDIVTNAYLSTLPGDKDYRKGCMLANTGHEDEAVLFLEKAAKEHHPYALYEIGSAYFHGKVVKQDKDLGMAYLIEAAKAGVGEAYFYLGYAYGVGKWGMEEDFEMAFFYYWKHYKYLSSVNNANGRSGLYKNMSYMLRKMGCSDYAKAYAEHAKKNGLDNADEFIKATNEELAKLPDAKDNADTLFARAQQKAAEGDDKAAFQLYRRAADLDHKEALLYTGISFFEGKGAPQLDEAASWFFDRAREAGIPEAYLYLGIIFDTGRYEIVSAKDAVWNYEHYYEKVPSARTAFDIARQYVKLEQPEKMRHWAQIAWDGGINDAEMLLNLADKMDQGYYSLSDEDREKLNIPKQDYEEGERLYKTAQTYLFEGRFDYAFKLLNQASILEYSPAKLVAGYFYWTGVETQTNVDHAVKLIKEAASGGVDGALGKAGDIYANGYGRKRIDFKTAIQFYEKAFANENTPSLADRLAQQYGNFKLEDENKMCYWIDQLKKLGGGEDRIIALQQDADKLHARYEKYPNLKEANELFESGLRLEKAGRASEAFENYLRAADLGFPKAMFNVGESYHEGNGVIKNNQKALEYFEKAGEEGMIHGYAKAGEILYSGNGGSRDYSKAAEYIKKAALATNNGKYYYDLAQCYVKMKMYKEAYKWAQESLQKGYADAYELCNVLSPYYFRID